MGKLTSLRGQTRRVVFGRVYTHCVPTGTKKRQKVLWISEYIQ